MSEKLTIEALRRDPAYLALTQQQRVLVETFLETGDKVKAVRAAYNCKSKESARVMSYAVFSNLRLVAALAAANGGSDLESFKQEVLNAARNKKLSIAQLGALKLYARLSGFVAGSSLADEPTEPPKPPEPPVAEHRFKVAMLVQHVDLRLGIKESSFELQPRQRLEAVGLRSAPLRAS